MSSVKLGAEDRFAVVSMDAESSLFAHPFDIGTLGHAAEHLRQQWRTLWDFREVDGEIYGDIIDAYDEAALWGSSPPVVLASPENVELVRSQLEHPARSAPRPAIVPMRSRALPSKTFDLGVFKDCYGLVDYTRLYPETPDDDYYESAIDLGVMQADEDLSSYREELDAVELAAWPDDHFLRWADAVQSEQAAVLDRFLRGIASNSLMTEIAVFVDDDTVQVVPYHAHSLHHVEQTTGDDVVLLRPARINHQYWRRFSRELTQLEHLLNQPTATEREIESLLVSNPLFLAGLNYRAIYPQVVLPRDSGRSFRPDIIAEPVDSEWSDIVELKLPSHKVLVGREGRASLSDQIHKAVRQLREYASYFDDRHHARRIEQRYGFHCHRPRLVVIIGRDPTEYTPEERRRAFTTYPDLEVITFDKLLAAARQRLLL